MARNHTFRGANLQYVSATKQLNNLNDVSIASSTDLDLLQYSSSSGKWTDVAAIKSLQIQDTSANHQYVFAVSELAADRTVTLPLLTGNDTFVFASFAATLANKTLTSPVLNTGVSGSAVLDQDDMSGNSATQLATQQSIKAYVDAQVATEDTLAELNDTTISGPASNDVLQYSGSAWVDRTYAEAGLVSLTGTETLTNKTLTAPTINGGTATALTDLDMTSGDKTILDTIGSNTLTIGAAGTTITIPGNLTVSGTQTTVSTTNTNISDKLITLNDGGSASSGTAVGIEVEEDSSATGYFKTAADRAGWELKAPSTAGVLSIDPSANSNTLAFGGSGKTFTISETATIDQDLSTTANVTHANLTATGNVTLGNAASDTVTITGTIQGASPLVFEGATGNAYETTLTITDPTADRTWTLPDASDTFVGLATADTLSNKTLASPVITTGDINTPDIDGGTVDAITSLTVANDVDLGNFTIRASNFKADAHAAGGVFFAGTDGVTSTDSDMTFSSHTMTVTNIVGGSLDIDDVLINGATIGHTNDTDLMTLASGVLTVAGEVSMTTLDIGGTNVTSTAAELNILDGVTSTTAELNIVDGVTSTAAELNLVDGSSANAVVNSKAVIYGSSGELAGTLSTAAQANITSVGTLTDLTVSGTSTTIGTVTSGIWNAGAVTSSGSLISAGSGDPALELKVTSGEEVSIGLDNNDGDKLKISDSTTVGTNTRFSMIPSTGETLFVAASGQPGILGLWADGGASNNDRWRLHAANGGAFTIEPYSSGSWNATALAINSDGNVGIGGAIVDSEQLGVYANTASKYAAIIDQDDASGYGLVVRVDGTGTSSGFLVLDASENHMFRVQQNGNVGIGASAPAQALHINAADAGPVIQLSRTDSSITGNNVLGEIYFGGTGGDTIKNSAYISAQAATGWSADDQPTKLIFATTADASETPVVHLTIDSDGNFTAGGGAASQQFMLETTGSTTNADYEGKIPASSTGNVSMIFKQGSGDGSANNQEFRFAYQASQSYFRFRNEQLGADVWRNSDGDASMDGNTTWDAGVFDDEDDAMVLYRAFGAEHKEPVYEQGKQILKNNFEELISLGILRRYDDGWVGYNDQRMAPLLAGGIYQNRFRMDTQFAELDARLKKLETEVST